MTTTFSGTQATLSTWAPAAASVAAMVRYFAIVPWEVPDDFSVDRYAETLLDLHRSKAELVFTQRRFLLIARA